MELPDTNVVSIIVGSRSTGKTHDVKESIKKIILERPDINVLIVNNADTTVWRFLDQDYEPQINSIPIIEKDQIPFWPEGNRIMRTAESDIDGILRRVEKYGSNLFVLVEDSGRYFTEGRIPKYIKDLCIDSKQKNVDTAFVYHYLEEVPKRLAKYADYLKLKKTGEVYNSAIRSKFLHPKLPEIMELIDKSNNKRIGATLYIGP